MLLFDGFGGVLALGLWIFCLIDVITTPENQCRNLPKIGWVLIVLLFNFVGGIVWLAAGHTWPADRTAGAAPGPRSWPSAGGQTRQAGNPDDDAEFLAGLKARAAEQRRRAQAQRPPAPPSAGDASDGDGPPVG